jgi:hypothetical protein
MIRHGVYLYRTLSEKGDFYRTLTEQLYDAKQISSPRPFFVAQGLAQVFSVKKHGDNVASAVQLATNGLNKPKISHNFKVPTI